MHHLSILYVAVLPALCAISNAYNQRRDAIYMITTVALSLSLALVSAARSLLERSKGSDDGADFCHMTARVLTLGLVALSYDSQPSSALGSAIPAWWVYALYTGMSLTNGSQNGSAYATEIVLRTVLTAAMLNELW